VVVITSVVLIQTEVQTHDELRFTGIAAAAADDDDDEDDEDDEMYIDEDETQQTSADATFCYLASCRHNRCKQISQDVISTVA